MGEDLLSKEEIINIAKVCHEANKSYCETIGDFSQVSWDEAPQWQKDSAIIGVRFHLGDPNSKPEDSHVSWSKEKIEQGWIYGEVKDPEKKTHPCLVPYNKLPKEQQLKDHLFLSIVRSLTKSV